MESYYNFLLIIPSLLLLYLVWRSYKSRNYVEMDNHTELVSAKINLDWSRLTILFYLIFIIFTNGKELSHANFKQNLILFFIAFFVFDIIIRYGIQRDRLILKNDQLIYLSNRSIKLNFSEINKIVLTNGRSYQLTIKGKKWATIDLDIHKFGDDNLHQLMNYLERHIDFNTIEVSDNLKSLVDSDSPQ